jgi:hypothetical protein
MDGLFGILTGFLEVQPIQTGQENALYRAWSFMRTIANIAFVIAFLIIIYSQLTNFGVSNYGIKKLLPRIIIAAILVNLSYVICSVAIDTSNVLGYGVQDIFIQIRNSLVGSEGNSWDVLSWESIAGFVLAGGTGAVAGGIAIVSAVSMGTAALPLLLTGLVTVLVAILIALAIMALRQALITILTVLAPLAFVAYLLPNTEKWFGKWRETFMTMLILFPAFSVIFGGSQLAGTVIIQNADSINLIILGLIVQVAPLFVTPLLLKFSGSLLGRIAGLVNNPQKGIIDRTRNFAKDRSDNMRAKRLGTTARPGVLGSGQRLAQRLDHNRRRREGWRNAHNAMADASWANSSSFSDIDQASRRASEEKQLGETLSQQRYTNSKVTNVGIRQLDVDVRQAKLNLENAELKASNENWEKNHSSPVVTSKLQQHVLKDEQAALHSQHDLEWDEFKGGEYGHAPMTAVTAALMRESQENTRRLALNAMRNESAKRVLTQTTTAELEANTTMLDGQLLQAYAGGIQGVTGSQRALASAISTQSQAHSEAIKNAQAILSHGNYNDSTIRQFALGNTVAGTNILVTDDIREAAILKIAGGPNTDEIIHLMEGIQIDSSPRTLDFRQAFYDSLMSNSAKPKWATAGVMAAVRDGTAPPAGQGRLDKWISDAFNADKFSSADTIVNHDKSYLDELANAMARNPALFNAQARARFKEQYSIATTNPRYKGLIGDSAEVLERLGKLI